MEAFLHFLGSNCACYKLALSQSPPATVLLGEGKRIAMKIAPTLCYKLGLSSKPVRDGSCREKRESAWHEHCSGANRKRRREDCASRIGEEENRQPERRKEERKRSRKRKTNAGNEEANRRHFGRDGAFCASIVIRLRQPTLIKYYVRAPEEISPQVFFFSILKRPSLLQQETFGTLQTTASLRTQGSLQHF